jgi:hypothetical protein
MGIRRRVIAVFATFCLGLASGIASPRTASAFECGWECVESEAYCQQTTDPSSSCEIRSDWSWWCLCYVQSCRSVPCTLS